MGAVPNAGREARTTAGRETGGTQTGGTNRPAVQTDRRYKWMLEKNEYGNQKGRICALPDCGSDCRSVGYGVSVQVKTASGPSDASQAYTCGPNVRTVPLVKVAVP